MKHVIIGAGPAAVCAAKQIRELRKDDEILMISIDEQVHSRCMLHKFLSHERTAEEIRFIEPDFFEKQRVQWMPGVKAEKLDPQGKTVVLSTGEQVSYDKLLIATGANYFMPPIENFREAENVFGLRDLSDAQKIDPYAKKGSRAVIVGAGLVGLDAAYALLERGVGVTVVEMADKILAMQLDGTAAGEYQRRFEEAGCRFLLSDGVASSKMNGEGRVTEVSTAKGETLPCDFVVVAAGVRAAVQLAEGTPIAVERGIVVDENLKTSCDDVYAAGDVAGLSGIWPNAMEQGRIAGINMCNIPFAYEDRYAVKNTINFFGLPALSIGAVKKEEGDEELIREDSRSYRRALMQGGVLRGIILQGDIANSGIYQYLIKNQINISDIGKSVFDLSFADFYGVGERGEYAWTK